MNFFPRSRRRVVVVTVVVLVALDLARSLLPRLAFHDPVTVWSPDQTVYANMTWPPATAVPAGSTPVQTVYLEHCAICHGPDGRGNGAAAPSMIPRPRDFTRGDYKYKTTPAGSPPSDADLYAVIANGLPGGGMPYWRDLLGDQDIRALVSYIKTMSPAFEEGSSAPVAIPPRGAADAASIGRGRKLYLDTGCAQCHGKDLRGGLAAMDQQNHPVVSRDLTAPWTFRGGAAPEQVWLRLTTGLRPGPMPSYQDSLTADQRWDIVNYVLANQRPAPWDNGGKIEGPGQRADLAARGQYLVHAEMCGLCHTEVSPFEIYREDHYLAGGMRVGAYPQGVFIARNLTSDMETGLGRWSEGEIVDALRNGRAPGGRLLNFWGMPWMYLHQFADDDATAIARYLKSLPPIHNAVPLALHYGVAETVVMKVLTWSFPIARPPVLTYAVGDYGNRPGLAPDQIETLLAVAQAIVLAAGLTLFVFAAPSGRRLPSTMSGRLIGGLACGLLATALGMGWFIYEMPAFTIIGPEVMAKGATGSIASPDVARLTPERAAMVKRGQYLFTVASCAYCHENDGSGGFKISGRTGSIFTSNISSDKEAGLGGWSDDEISRAIRGGVSRDGRPLYWQGMPWDHFSNWDEEDVRAIIAYLREIPPVAEKVPPFRPHAADDCEGYAFWTHKTKEPGCRG